MSRIAEKFQRLAQSNQRALVAFVTAGDPSLEELPDILLNLQECGVDLIEVGMPFSDPIADGPTIQASSQRALDRGTRTSQIFDSLASVDLTVPVILMGYYNTVLAYGMESFAQAAQKAGASGTILCDATPEEAGDWVQTSRQTGLDNIFLVAPTSTDARLQLAAGQGTGFTYAVARTGVTGQNSSAEDQSRELVGRIKGISQLPVCVGFGIASAEQVRDVCTYADGAVVGSALVQRLYDSAGKPAEREEVWSWVRSLKQATL